MSLVEPYSPYLSAPLLRPSFVWEVQPYLLPGKVTSSFTLSSHPTASPDLLQSSCLPLGAPQCPAVPFQSQHPTRGSVNPGISSWRAGGMMGHSPQFRTFPLLPTLLAEPGFCSAGPLLPGPGSEGSLSPREMGPVQSTLITTSHSPCQVLLLGRDPVT